MQYCADLQRFYVTLSCCCDVYAVSAASGGLQLACIVAYGGG